MIFFILSIISSFVVSMKCSRMLGKLLLMQAWKFEIIFLLAIENATKMCLVHFLQFGDLGQVKSFLLPLLLVAMKLETFCTTLLRLFLVELIALSTSILVSSSCLLIVSITLGLVSSTFPIKPRFFCYALRKQAFSSFLIWTQYAVALYRHFLSTNQEILLSRYHWTKDQNWKDSNQ